MVEGGPEKEKKRRETREKEGGKSEEAMVRAGTTGESEKDGKQRERAAVRPSELDI